MNARHLLDAFEMIDEQYVLQAKEATMSIRDRNRPFRMKKAAALIAAAVILLLALCGFAARELGFFDPWLQKPSAVPTETVKSAIEGQLEKEYTLAVRIDEVSVDEAETKRMIESYTGSDLAKSRGWTDDFLRDHFLAVRAKYYAEYDHAKTFLPDGDTDRYFYLVEDTDTGLWTVIDNSTGGQPSAD